MRVSLGGLLVVLGWLTFAQAVHNIVVDHSDTSQLTYLPASAWVEVELGAEDTTVDQYNGTATMASTIGAQVSLMFEGTAIYWLGYGTNSSSQLVEVIVDDVTVLVNVSSAGFGATSVAFFRPDLRMDELHNITVRIIENDDSSAVLYHVAFIYTIPYWSTQSPIGVASVLENEATLDSQSTATPTLDSQPIATPTTSRAEQTSDPNKRNQVIAIMVIVGLVGLGVLVGGLVLLARRRRWKIDAERSSRPYNAINGEEGPPRFGMLETSIARARYGGLEPSVLSSGGQITAISPMKQATLVGGVIRQNSREPRRARPPDLTLSEPRSRTRTETLRATTTVPQGNNQRVTKRPLLESIMSPNTALPPYPGSPPTRQ